ncbi:thiamine diphosphokinase [Lachnospiraceae bacterium JLR.KK008]
MDKNSGNKDGRCILVCAGDLEISEIPVKPEDYVIAVDGGYLYCQVFGIEPDVMIGDFDSLAETYCEQTQPQESGRPHGAEGKKPRVIRLDCVKDDTDTLAAIRHGLENGYREFHLYGALGGRLEHTIANLQCLHFLKNAGAVGYIWDGTVMITLIRNESLSFRKEMEGLVSVFAVGGEARGVTEKGLRYALDDAVVRCDFPIGVSNEFTGQKAEIEVRDGSLLIVVRWE